jgi:hypothetical protein
MIILNEGGMKVVISDGAGTDRGGKKSAEEISRLTPAQRLDYARQFPQNKMPEWRDPRAAQK